MEELSEQVPNIGEAMNKECLDAIGGHYHFFSISHPNTNRLEVCLDLNFFGPRKSSFTCPNHLHCQRFLNRLRDGDNSLEADLLTACENRSEEWHPRDNSCNSLDIKSERK